MGSRDLSGDIPCEVAKVVEVPAANGVHYAPIHRLILMHSEIAKTDGTAHAFAEFAIDDSRVSKAFKRGTHSRRRRFAGCRKSVQREVNAELHGAA